MHSRSLHVKSVQYMLQDECINSFISYLPKSEVFSLLPHCLKSQGSVHLQRTYLTGFKVLTAMIMKIQIFWYMMRFHLVNSYFLEWLLSPCSLLVIPRRLLKLWRCSLVRHLTPEYTGNILLQNIGNCLPVATVSPPRRFEATRK